MKKFDFTGETMVIYHPLTKDRITLRRIIALRELKIPISPTQTLTVNPGDKGGWIEHDGNLSHEGNCWIMDSAKAFDNARREGNSLGIDYSQQHGNSIQKGNSIQSGYSQQYGNSIQSGQSRQMGRSRQFENSTQLDFSMQKGRSKQYGSSRQTEYSSQDGFSQQYESSIQMGNSHQTGHSRQYGNSTQGENSVQNDFSRQCGSSIQRGNSVQSGHSRQYGSSIQEGTSKQHSFSIQYGDFVHTYGNHNTASNKGYLHEGTVFLEVANIGKSSISLNYNSDIQMVTTSTGYRYRLDEYEKFRSWVRKHDSPETDKRAMLLAWALLTQIPNIEIQL